MGSEEQEYLKESRAILENLFFKDPSLKQHIIKEDIVRLIRAKHIAYSQNDRGFEQMLLDIGKACDELSRETDDFSCLRGIQLDQSPILTGMIMSRRCLSQMSFMKNIEFREESLRSLVGNKKDFDELDSEPFQICLYHGSAGQQIYHELMASES